MPSPARFWLDRCAALVAAVALVLLGAAHRIAPQGPPPWLAAYAIPGGPAPTLCLGADDDGAPELAQRCIACLVGQATLPRACDAPGRAAGWTEALAEAPDASRVAPHAFRAPPVRGPPPSRVL